MHKQLSAKKFLNFLTKYDPQEVADTFIKIEECSVPVGPQENHSSSR